MIDAVLPRFPKLEVAVSATTRPRRPGERDGVEYHFLDRQTFEEQIGADNFLEHVVYAGHLYGTLKSEVEKRLAAGISVVGVTKEPPADPTLETPGRPRGPSGFQPEGDPP